MVCQLDARDALAEWEGCRGSGNATSLVVHGQHSRWLLIEPCTAPRRLWELLGNRSSSQEVLLLYASQINFSAIKSDQLTSQFTTLIDT